MKVGRRRPYKIPLAFPLTHTTLSPTQRLFFLARPLPLGGRSISTKAPGVKT